MRPSDWPRVCAIYGRAVEEGMSTFQTECPSYEQWDASHLPDCRLVLTVGDTVAGWCALSPTSSRPAYLGVVEDSIYLDPAYRRQGVGAALLQKLCQESEKAGYWSIYACIYSINTGSCRLHEACGFRKIGYREKIAKDRFGQWQDTTLYERRSALL
ncbi:MAG: N-acetyltransferase [Clostridiales bacterium]|nr:N-acetyltransferase [Clostridiales bacterium]